MQLSQQRWTRKLIIEALSADKYPCFILCTLCSVLNTVTKIERTIGYADFWLESCWSFLWDIKEILVRTCDKPYEVPSGGERGEFSYYGVREITCDTNDAFFNSKFRYRPAITHTSSKQWRYNTIHNFF